MNSERSYYRRLVDQTKAVSHKNLFNLWINKYSVAFMIVLPLVLNVTYYSVTKQMSKLSFSNKISLEVLEKCKNYDVNGQPFTPKSEKDKCRTLVYAPTSNLTDTIMRLLAKQNNLEYGVDIMGYNDTDSYIRAIYPPYASGLRYAVAGVYFNVQEGSPTIIDYHIWSNSSYSSMVYGTLDSDNDAYFATIQNSIENSINSFIHTPLSRSAISVRNNPSNLDAASVVGAHLTFSLIVIVCGSLYTLYWAVSMINEKRGSMISYMRCMGMMESSNLLGYFSAYFIMCIIAAILCEISGRLCGILFFLYCPYGLLTLILTLFFIHSSTLGMFIFTCVIKTWTLACLYCWCLIISLQSYYMPFSSLLSPIPFFVNFPNPVCMLKQITSVMMSIIVDSPKQRFNWSDITKVIRYEDRSITVLTLFGLWLISFCMLYLYCWYFSYKSMCKKKYCFLLDRSFWSSAGTVRIEGVDTRDKDSVLSQTNKSIVFSYTTKVFDSCTAVKELHLEVKQNQIFTLLGPNGSGKTTAISMLTGVFPPTYGDIFVDGISVVSNSCMIQDHCGVCNQFDYFWPEYTPRQMFTVMGLFKGLSLSKIDSECKRLLEMMKIDKYVNMNATTFSGGMKRKLSVALACMDGCTTLILDEPTSGMDPISRSELWSVLMELKKNHTILLTTHSMEEADTLSDTVGIMYLGRLRAIGSPYGLRQTYGKGYKVDVILNMNHNANDVFDLMRSYMINTEMIAYTTASLSVGIGRDDMKLLPRFLLDINRLPCTKEWLISPSNLDEVFMKVIETNRDVAEADKILEEMQEKESRREIKMCVVCGLNPSENVTLYNKKGRAMVVESVYCKHCCDSSDSDAEDSITIPRETTIHDENETTVEASYMEQSPLSNDISQPLLVKKEEIVSQKRDNLILSQTNNVSSFHIVTTLTWLNAKLTLKDWKRFIFPVIALAIWVLVVLIFSRLPLFFTKCDDGSYSGYGGCIDNDNPPKYEYDTDVSIIPNGIPQYFDIDRDVKNISILIQDYAQSPLSSARWPYNLLSSSVVGTEFYIFKQSQNIEKEMVEKVSTLVRLADSQGNNFYTINATSFDEAMMIYGDLMPQVSIYVEKFTKQELRVVFGMHTYSNKGNGVIFEYSPLPLITKSTLRTWITVINRLRLHENINETTHIYFPHDAVYSIQSKSWVKPKNIFIVNIITLFIPFFMVIMSLMVIYRVINDKATDRTRILFLNNVTTSLYTTSLMIHFVLFFLAVTIILFIVMYSIGEAFKPSIIMILLLLWECVHSAAFYVAFSLLFSSPTLAATVSVCLNCAASIPFTLFFNMTRPIWLTILPGSSTALFITQSIVGGHVAFDAIRSTLIVTVVVTVCCIVFAYVFSWLREDMMNVLDKYYQRKRSSTEVIPSNQLSITLSDDDTVEEAHYVSSLYAKQQPTNRHGVSLLVSNITKGFHTNNGFRVIFPSLSFSIHDNEVFGLLGPNGAGKTTLINLLTGKMNPNNGNVKVFGYSNNEKRRIKELIGVVPQFDVFFEEMTVSEHLQLVARLHGVKNREVVYFSKEVSEQVGLERDSFHHKSAQLSGGQKRRLTLGMALISRPLLLFLDEPTTGLDMESRLAIWKTVRSMQEKMSILLTTHSMEEADALCSRIAIMTNDGLQCIGSQVHLKNKFGRGLMFSVTLDSSILNVTEYVKTVISADMEFIETKHNVTTFTIAKEKVDLELLLRRVTELQMKKLLLFWSLNQSSLGDVFLRVCKHEE